MCISGMRGTVAAATGKSAAGVVHNIFGPILYIACIQAKTVTKGRLDNDKANGKGKGWVGVCRGCAIHAHPSVGGTH